MYSTEIATMMLPIPAPSTAAMAMARMRPGNEYSESITRVSTRSVQPPTKPLIRPTGTPMTTEASAEVRPTIRAIRVPQMVRLRMSCPIWLVPSTNPFSAASLTGEPITMSGKSACKSSNRYPSSTKPSMAPLCTAARPSSRVSKRSLRG